MRLKPNYSLTFIELSLTNNSFYSRPKLWNYRGGGYKVQQVGFYKVQQVWVYKVSFFGSITMDNRGSLTLELENLRLAKGPL